MCHFLKENIVLGCSSIEDMKESNRIELESAAAAEAKGYKPCSRCH